MNVYDEYKLLLEPVGSLDASGNMSNAMQTFFIEIPFAFLRLLASFVTFFLDLLDVSAKIKGERSVFFEESKDIYLKLIGGTNGRISTGSLAFILLVTALMYLTWHFFFGKGAFAKKALHVLAVISLGFAYYGNFNVVVEDGGGKPQDGQKTTPMSGGLYLFKTVDNVSEQLKSQMVTTFSVGKTDGSLTSQGGYGEYYKNYIILNTFNYINSGSTNGEYATKKKLDHSKLIPAEGLSTKEKKAFYKEREGYLKGISEDNPYVQNNVDKMTDKLAMIALSYANAVTLGLPVVFANVTLSIFQFVFLLLILLFPLALVASFTPFFKNAVFRVLKIMLGILFMPALIGFMLGIFFYLNGVIDNFILSKAGDVLGAAVAVSALGGTNLIVVMMTLIVIKAVLFYLVWKNKGKFLKLISDNKLDDTIVNAPVNKIKEVGEKAMDTGTDVVQSAVGAYTGNPQMMMAGMNGLMGKEDGTVPSTGDNLFKDRQNRESDDEDEEEGINEDKSLEMNSLDNLMEEDSESEESKDIQDVHVVNSKDLLSEDELDERLEDITIQTNDLDGGAFNENSSSVGNLDLSKTPDGVRGEDFVESNEIGGSETVGGAGEIVGNSLFYDSVPDESLFTVEESLMAGQVEHEEAKISVDSGQESLNPAY